MQTNERDTPGVIGLNELLGPLPEPAWFAPQMITEDAYSAAQMLDEKLRGFVEGVMRERERCALLCESEAEKWEVDGMAEPMSRLCAIAIRAPAERDKLLRELAASGSADMRAAYACQRLAASHETPPATDAAAAGLGAH